jgi:hypothetical protein
MSDMTPSEPSKKKPSVVWVPADQGVEPPDIQRMREGLERGEVGDPDAVVLANYHRLFPASVRSHPQPKSPDIQPKQ